jgi:hypothetical protein
MVPVRDTVKAEMMKGGSEKTDYRNRARSEKVLATGEMEDAF